MVYAIDILQKQQKLVITSAGCVWSVLFTPYGNISKGKKAVVRISAFGHESRFKRKHTQIVNLLNRILGDDAPLLICYVQGFMLGNKVLIYKMLDINQEERRTLPQDAILRVWFLSNNILQFQSLKPRFLPPPS